MTHSWFDWLRYGPARTRGTRRRHTPKVRRSKVPQLLVLEDRTVLSTLTVLNGADSGAGSLRDTLAAAQSGDTIVFDASLMHQTITLTSGPLPLHANLTIEGPGADLLAISGNNASQLFTLGGTAEVILAYLTLTGGISNQGGAILIGGGAALTLESDILSGNQAIGDANGNALGGAVYNSAGASLTIDNTSFVNNQTNGTNESFGGAIANTGSLLINGATFTGNAALGSTTNFGSSPAASAGGAIGNLDGATATITLSTFTANQALGTGSAAGGAICNEDADVFPFTGSGVTSTLSQCSFDNNLAKGGSSSDNGGAGGAIEDLPGVNVAVLNCSFTGNQAIGGYTQGGAIDDSPAVTGAIFDSQFLSNIAKASASNASGGAIVNFQTMMIANSSFTGNSAVGGPMTDTTGQAQGGAIATGYAFSSGAKLVILTLSNSIVAGNEAIGGSGGSTLTFPRTGAAGGGGIANLGGAMLNIAGCTITGNRAIGGASAQGSGGPAIGGGIDDNRQTRLNVTNSMISANVCQGGAGADGSAGGIAVGGGIANDVGAIAIITNSVLSLNESLGGSGGAGANGGAAVGGGIENAVYAFAYGVPDASSLTVSSCQLIGNMAQGGTAGSSAAGGDALGGSLFAGGGTMVLKGVLVSGNEAQGGLDSQQKTTGQGLGGGVYVDPSATATADMQTLIAGNQASKDKADVWGTITIVP